MREISIQKIDAGYKVQFQAMACPCEVLVETEDQQLTEMLGKKISDEAWRIEDKFSRYRNNNIIHIINHSAGKPVIVDEETARLIDFASELYQLSDGLFDITSGILRRAWVFDGSDTLPAQSVISALLDSIGWHRVSWKAPELILDREMEIDLGGIGKEYAVDSCVNMAKTLCNNSVLVNFGGDLAVSYPRKANAFWSVGRLITGREQAVAIFQLVKGAIATSGDAHRYLLKDGIRYSHVLNPKTGWPVENAPHTVSVAAPTCVEAGMMSTLAMLHGEQAGEFLELQQIEYWID